MNLDRLLVIEDEEGISRIISIAAKSCGYSVMATQAIEDFVAILTSWKPTHVVLDLHMPDVDGIEVLRILAARHSTAQILIVSGADARVVDTAERIGLERGLQIVGTMLKPFHLADMKTKLEEIKGHSSAITASALRRAIDNDELCLVYQPKIEIASMNMTGLEGLIRWQHPERGLISPSEFLHLAEDNFMDELTQAVVTIGLRQMALWQKDGMSLDVSLNISGRNLHDIHFADAVVAMCRKYDVSPSHLSLELTETATAEHALEAMDILTRLRIKMIKLAIDDFGTGYSSLVQLHRLPFSDIKIDKGFVSVCHDSRESQAIVRTIIDLAHNLGMKAVAEGVENEEIVSILSDLHCDAAQGFHFSKPIPADQVPGFVAAWTSNDRPKLRPMAL